MTNPIHLKLLLATFAGWVHREQAEAIDYPREENAPDRPTSWRTFLRSHADLIGATDFFTTEVWTARGLVTYYTLFVIDISTRAVYIAGTTTSPDDQFMA